MVATSKNYIGNAAQGMMWHGSKPKIPSVGDAFYDVTAGAVMVFDGSSWAESVVGKSIEELIWDECCKIEHEKEIKKKGKPIK